MSEDKKVALITGASRGIGQEILKELGSLDFEVIGTATTEKGAQAITDKIKELGFKGKGMVLNVAEDASVESCLKDVISEFETLSVLVNNAGITKDNLLLRMKPEDWDSVINTNLSSVYRLSKAVLRPMMKKSFGRIINIASVVAVSGNAGQTNYAATKAGVIGFSKSLAREVASRGITVNTVAPGYIQTDMTNMLSDKQKEELTKNIPAGKLGTPKDIAGVVGFLSSDKSGYITGETIHINGGMYMS